MVALVVGFLVGWLLEYYLDLKYWELRAKRRGLTVSQEQGTSDAETTPVFVGHREADVASDTQLAATLQEFFEKREEEISAVRQELERQKAHYTDLSRQFEQYMATHPDDLTAIRGIGRIYQWKLRDAGISSYEQLASTTPEQLREILDVPAWRKFEPGSWIEQAKVLSQRGD
jgi:predicted flap endonuclease-1-like 5' DNA nuclease